MSIFNLIMGAIALAIGYSQDITFLIVIGYIIAGLAVLSILRSLLLLKSAKSERQN